MRPPLPGSTVERRARAALAALALLASCGSSGLSREELLRAERMVIDPGKPFGYMLEGDNLRAYLKQFALDEHAGRAFVHFSRPGTITIAGKQMALTYAEEKTAARTPILIVETDTGPVRFRLQPPQ